MISSLVPIACKKRKAPGTHCLRMRLISPRCGDSGLFSDSSVSCDVRVRTRKSKLVRIIIVACNESLDFQQAISHVLQQLPTPSMVFQTCNSACTSHTRFGKPPPLFNVCIFDRVLILDASLSWLTFFTKQCYSMVAITHRGSTKAANQCYFR